MIQRVDRPISSNGPPSVAILAGGRSSRMGSNKALLHLSPNGPTLLERVIEATTGLGDDLFIVSRLADDYLDFEVPAAADQYPDTGVLGAIGTALQHAANPTVLIVSCDMPFLNRAALKWMAAINERYDALVPVLGRQTRQGGSFTYQTMHAIYRKSCLPAIETELNMGNRRVVSFFDQIDIRQVSENEIRKFDPDLLTFMSVNTPEQLQLAIKLERKRQSL